MTDTASEELLADMEEAMRDVVDPELGINVVDLGLLYGLNVEKSETGTVAGDEDVLGDGIAFAGVSKYPARVKCALLGWLAFKAAVAEAAVSTGACHPDLQEEP